MSGSKRNLAAQLEAIQKLLSSKRGAGITEAEARRRERVAIAALREVELAERQGAVAAIADCERAWAAMHAAARARLLGLGAKLGPMVAVETEPAACQRMIDGQVHAALAELAASEPEIRDGGGGVEKPAGGVPAGAAGVGASAGTDGKRVGGRAPKVKR